MKKSSRAEDAVGARGGRIDPQMAARQESAIKKVRVEDLRPGMFVSDLNAGWMSHPFLFNSLAIKTAAQIEELVANGIREVYIDTRRGADVPDALTLAEDERETRRQMLDSARDVPNDAPPPRRRPPSAAEIARARRVLNQGAELLQQTLHDVRLGKPVDVDPLRKAAEDIATSIMHDPSAMTLVCRLRRSSEYTFAHSLNVGVLLTGFAHQLGLDLATTQAITLGGLLHDIGKLGVDEAILNKPGKLSDEEFAHMRTHVSRGLSLVEQQPLAPASRQVIAEHHERFDGSGYPRGLGSPAISLAGRMAAIVDVYDAISSDRCYHKGLPAPEAMRRIFAWRDHFDLDLVVKFVRCIGIYPVGSLVRLESQRLAVVVAHDSQALTLPVVRVIFDLRRMIHLSPRDIDLADSGSASGDAIVGHEDAARWGIDVTRHVL